MNDLTADSTSKPEVLELERVFKAPPERVFEAFASEDALKQWFGPGYCAVLWAEIDFTEGGEYHLRLMVEDNGEIDLVGRYRKIDKPRQLSFSWRWEGNPNFNPCGSLVEMTFSEHADGTLLRLRQTGIDDSEDRAKHGIGWGGSFDNLEKLFN